MYLAAYLLFNEDAFATQGTPNALPTVQAEFSAYCYLTNRPPLGVNLIEWWQVSRVCPTRIDCYINTHTEPSADLS
jgi:hypothetical protein